MLEGGSWRVPKGGSVREINEIVNIKRDVLILVVKDREGC